MALSGWSAALTTRPTWPAGRPPGAGVAAAVPILDAAFSEVSAMTDIDGLPAWSPRSGRGSGLRCGVLKTMGPRQWVKNILVFAAPFVGGDLLTPGIVRSC